MLPLRKRLEQVQHEKKANWEIIELDYALSWILIAITKHNKLANRLVFKGGTALKKCYFGKNYRFSQDLDFTDLEKEKTNELDQFIYEIVDFATKAVKEYGDLQFKIQGYKGKGPHPTGQKAYIIRVKYPWHREPLTKIKLEITRDEEILKPINKMQILHEYGEKFKQKIQTYSLEEIIAEKYRGLLQNQEKLKKRGWIRSRVRDFYDLWKILSEYKESLNLNNFEHFFRKKCSIKDIYFEGIEQFFLPNYLKRIEQDWEQFLETLLNELPCFDKLIIDLKKLTSKVFIKEKIFA